MIPPWRRCTAGWRKYSGERRGNAAAAELGKALAKDASDPDILSHQLFCLNYLPDSTPAEMTEIAGQYGAAVRANITPFDTWQCSREHGRKLRIGMVSGDFRRHPVGFLLRGPLREIDKAEFRNFRLQQFPARRCAER